MLSNTRKEDLSTMLEIGRLPSPEGLDDIPHSMVVSSFMLSELKTAFITASYEGLLLEVDWNREGLPLNFLNIGGISNITQFYDNNLERYLCE
mgnify:CR=1 FL=1